MAKNYYAILGVEPNATIDQIKKAYRELVKKWHPDFYGPDSSPFLKIKEAYDVLSNPKRREAYDRSLKEKKENQYRIRTYPEYRNRSRSPVEPLIPRKQNFSVNKLKMSGHIRRLERYSGYFLYRFTNCISPWERWQAQTRNTIEVEIHLSSTEAQKRKTFEIDLPIQMTCPLCNGFGFVGFAQCFRCHGSGQIEKTIPLSISLPSNLFRDTSRIIPLDSVGLPNYNLLVHFLID